MLDRSFEQRALIEDAENFSFVEEDGQARTMPESHVFHYGDNLKVMREWVPDASVDLIYLDPPFNSAQDYNVPFTEEDGTPSEAQARAFRDYWKWGEEAEAAFAEATLPRERRRYTPSSLSELLHSLRRIIGTGEMLAYLSMMSLRLIELRRVLKPTGSLYLHCDPTASHYLKLVLDTLFPGRFRNEIIWKRTSGHSDAVGYGSVHDVILFYTNGEDAQWNEQHVEYDDDYAEKYYRYKDRDGRRFMSDNLSAAGLQGGGYTYEWKGVTRLWRCPMSTMRELDRDGRVYYTKNGIARIKRYLDEAKGLVAQDIWTDIEPLRSWHKEKTGWPTQKPLGLLKRIVLASSKPGDLVLDPFCGCGTAVVAAQELGRQWIGIDITHLAVSVLRRRLSETFPHLDFKIRGEPEDVKSAHALAESNPWEFQAWMVDKVGGVPLNPYVEKGIAKKGKDRGIDGLLMFKDDPKLDHSKRMILSAKAGKTTTPEMVDALHGVVSREKAAAGALLVAHAPSKGVYNEAREYGTYTASMSSDSKRYPLIQVITVEDAFSPRWKSPEFPGWNTSRTSVPPAGAPGASEMLFELYGRPQRNKSRRKPVAPEQEALPGIHKPAPPPEPTQKRGRAK